ncbi:MAG: hypothetical protein JJW01_03675 [Alphaproteobacteria bacterium]|nr:hypothetical protein [Rickettsiales bacterium]
MEIKKNIKTIHIPEELPFCITNIVEHSNLANFLIITNSVLEMHNMEDDLKFLLQPNNFCITTIPELNIEPFGHNSPTLDIQQQRVASLANILTNQDLKQIIIATPMSLITKTIPKERLQESLLQVKKGGCYNLIHLRNALVNNGYTSVDDARKVGEVSLCGEILNIANTINSGVRVMFNEDVIDKIIVYNLVTQNIIKQLHDITLFPISESLRTNEIIDNFIKKYKELGLDIESLHFNAIVNNIQNAPFYTYLSLLYGSTSTIIDYIKPNCLDLILCDGVAKKIQTQCSELNNLYKKSQEIYPNTIYNIEASYITNPADIINKTINNKVYEVTMI